MDILTNWASFFLDNMVLIVYLFVLEDCLADVLEYHPNFIVLMTYASMFDSFVSPGMLIHNFSSSVYDWKMVITM